MAALGLTAAANEVVSPESEVRTLAKQLTYSYMCKDHINTKEGYTRDILVDKIDNLLKENSNLIPMANLVSKKFSKEMVTHANRVGKGNIDEKVIHATCGKFLNSNDELMNAYEIRPLGVDA